MPSSTFRELHVWQDAMKLTAEIYRRTEAFPKHELYGLTNQMRRAAVSVPSNIAEGKGYHSDKELTRFLRHARGSLLELETQILIAKELQYLNPEEGVHLFHMADAVCRRLNGLIKALQEAA